jgi:hypothetical protein
MNSFETCPHKRGEKGIRTKDLRFIRRGLSRLNYLLGTLYNEFWESFKLTSHFRVIAHMWLALFPGSLQMLSEPPSSARSCGIGALYNVALTRTSRI